MATNPILINEEDQFQSVKAVLTSIRRLAAEIETEIQNAEAASEIATVYVKSAHAQRVLAEVSSQINSLENRLKTITVPEIFEAKKSGSIVAIGYRVTTSTKVRASIYKDYKDEAFSWLRDNGHGDIIKTEPSIHPSTFEAWARTQLEEGEDLPEKLFSIYYYNTTSVTKAPVKK